MYKLYIFNVRGQRWRGANALRGLKAGGLNDDAIQCILRSFPWYCKEYKVELKLLNRRFVINGVSWIFFLFFRFGPLILLYV